MNKQKNALNEIRKILFYTQSGVPLLSRDPRTAKAFLAAAPAALAGFVFSYMLLGLSIAALIYIAVYARTPAETWSQRFYNLMSNYAPLDRAAYQDLMSKIEANTCTRDDVACWLSAESAHVERPDEVAAKRALMRRRLKEI